MTVSKDVTVSISVSITIYFDDSTSKEFTICKGDIISLSYRTKNGTIMKKVGKIKAIRLTDRNIQYGAIQDFEIYIDASESYDSDVIIISSNDILDIDYVDHTDTESNILEDNMLIDADECIIRLTDSNKIIIKED